MIVGVIEKLDRMVRKYREGDENVDFDDVMDCVVDSVACDDCWYVSAELMEDGMNETDFEESRCIGDLPLFKTALVNGEDEKYLAAYTSEEAVRGSERGRPMITVKYRAKALLEDLLASEECAGIVINPWSDDFVVSKENAGAVLENAEKVPPAAVRRMQTVRLEPKAVIDANAIIKDWQDGWHDEEGKEDDWRLESYPVMADGRVLLVFSMTDITHGPSYEDGHRLTRYRVMEYSIAGEVPELLNRYKFKVQDGTVGTVTLYDGVLRAAVAPDSDEANWSLLQMYPVDDDAQFHIFRDVETAVSDSEGNWIVAYTRNLYDQSRQPLMVFDKDGNKVTRYRDRTALACRDVNLDADENIWFLLYPSMGLNMLDYKTGEHDWRYVCMQGFDAFALSSDRSKLFVHFSEHNGGSVQYVLTADEDGDFWDPIRFDFRPEDADGNPLEAKDCKVFGRMASNKNIVILNADGRLYVYDIDDCCEKDEEEGGKE